MLLQLLLMLLLLLFQDWGRHVGVGEGAWSGGRCGSRAPLAGVEVVKEGGGGAGQGRRRGKRFCTVVAISFVSEMGVRAWVVMLASTCT